MAAQGVEIGVADGPGLHRGLHREIEHRALLRRDVGFAVVDRDLVGDQRILRADAQDRAVRDHAVLALVGAGGGDHDHFALGLGQAALLFHQRVVIGEERAEFVRAVREGEEHVGHEARLLLHRDDALADVLRQVFELGYGVTADGAHALLLVLPCARRRV